MKVFLKKSFLTLLLCSVSNTPALADTGNIAVGLKAGTPGIGLEVTAGITSAFNLRTGFNNLGLNGNATKSDIDYDTDVTLSSIPVLIDWLPFEGSGYHVTGGIFINNNEIKGSAKSQASYKIGDQEYSAGEVGSLTGKMDYNSISPYFGIGWGNAVGKDTRFSVSMNIGVILQGNPDVGINADGTLKNNPLFQKELDKEAENLKNEIDEYEYFPVITAGFSYKLL